MTKLSFLVNEEQEQICVLLPVGGVSAIEAAVDSGRLSVPRPVTRHPHHAPLWSGEEGVWCVLEQPSYDVLCNAEAFEGIMIRVPLECDGLDYTTTIRDPAHYWSRFIAPIREVLAACDLSLA